MQDGTFWSAKESDYRRGYFHDAALTGADLRGVAAWVSGADPQVSGIYRHLAAHEDGTVASGVRRGRLMCGAGE